MSANTINLVVLSGQIGWLKIKYTSTSATYVNFTIKQPEWVYENNKIVSKSYTHIFITCFDLTVWSGKPLKEGAYVTIQGKISPYIHKTSKEPRLNIIAEKIDISGYEKED